MLLLSGEFNLGVWCLFFFGGGVGFCVFSPSDEVLFCFFFGGGLLFGGSFGRGGLALPFRGWIPVACFGCFFCFFRIMKNKKTHMFGGVVGCCFGMFQCLAWLRGSFVIFLCILGLTQLGLGCFCPKLEQIMLDLYGLTMVVLNSGRADCPVVQCFDCGDQIFQSDFKCMLDNLYRFHHGLRI